MWKCEASISSGVPVRGAWWRPMPREVKVKEMVSTR